MDLLTIRSDVENLTHEERIEVAKSKLITLHPLCKEAEDAVRKIGREITYWSNLKHRMEYELVTIEKLPSVRKNEKKAKNDKKVSIKKLIGSLVGMSDMDKKRLRKELLG